MSGKPAPNPGGISFGLQRALEIFNLTTGVYCVCATLFLWIRSPLPPNESGVVTGISLIALYALPFLFITSVILLFLDFRRGVFGIAAFVIAAAALSQCSSYMV
ncbi:MAG TPA: hypothetical protein PLS03_12960 [Terrimicrobiaceae bacterium]|nr:hypothetical protein [Terrimicrobiaceae bacterium]